MGSGSVGLEIRHETQHEIGGWAQVFGVTDTEVNEPGPAVNDEALGALEAEILDTVEREDIGVGGPGREPSDRSTVESRRLAASSRPTTRRTRRTPS